MSAIIANAQLISAFNLAGSHGHLWASALYNDARLSGDMSIEDIEAASAAQESSFGGISAPDYDEENKTIEHVTGTGRIRWEVKADGDSLIEICRPCEGVIAQIWARHVDASKAYGGIAFDHVECIQHDRLWARHVSAVMTAVHAICPIAAEAVQQWLNETAGDDTSWSVYDGEAKEYVYRSDSNPVIKTELSTAFIPDDGFDVIGFPTSIEEYKAACELGAVLNKTVWVRRAEDVFVRPALYQCRAVVIERSENGTAENEEYDYVSSEYFRTEFYY